MASAKMIYYLFVATLFCHLAAVQKCPPGTYFYTIRHTGKHFCKECEDETFMSNKDHQQRLCRPCEKIKEPELEILISPCNKTHDAVIHCVDGYYRDEARNPRETGQCKKCTQCKFAGKPCSTYRDTVCCWDENYDVVSNRDGVPVCIERPWFCRRGQYFDIRGFYCLPCPDNTFMPLDYHIQTQCWECKESKPYRPLHSVIIQPCNSTHAPVIRCEDGYFMDPKMSYRDDAIGCSLCTDCSTKIDVQYEGRKCDGMEDTVCCPQLNMTVVDTSDGPVCCPQPNMTIVDTSDGPVCTAGSADCDEGHCLHLHVRTNSITCAPCMDITDLDVTTTRSTTQGDSSILTDTRFNPSTEAEADCNCLGHVPSVFIGSVLGVGLTVLTLFVITQMCLKKNE